MTGFIFTPKAGADVREIWSFIAKNNPDAADRLLHDILDACRNLTIHPKIGHCRNDITDLPVLFFTVRRNYQIVYDPNTNPLEVIRVFHGARNAGALLIET